MLPRLAKSGSNCSLFGMFLEDGNSMERCEETVSCTSLDQFEFGVLNFFLGGGGRVFFSVSSLQHQSEVQFGRTSEYR